MASNRARTHQACEQSSAAWDHAFSRKRAKRASLVVLRRRAAIRSNVASEQMSIICTDRTMRVLAGRWSIKGGVARVQLL